jgi:biopolymer transport protein ExbD
MIDVVFLLLIFFLVGAKIRAPEEKIKLYLPKDRGPGTVTEPWDLVEVRIRLEWLEEEGRCSLKVLDEECPYRRVYDRRTRKREIIPNWDHFQAMMADFQQSYGGVNPKGLPVILDAKANVPWKHVVSTVAHLRNAGVRDITFSSPPLQ